MRAEPDWWIQASWWGAGIFATGAVWYFLSTREYSFAIAAGVAALALAILAVVLHKMKDAFQVAATSVPQPPAQENKLVTAAWWEASDLRKEYVGRGLHHFHWSNAERVAEREQQGHEIVQFDSVGTNIRYRIVNKSGQILMAKRDA